MKLALIDLGSNSARMFILNYDCAKKEFTYISRRREMTRLSEGMGEDLLLKELPMRRTAEALKSFAEEAEKEGAHIFAVATAAVRKAKNRDGFLSMSLSAGIPLNIISGEAEAFFDSRGVLDGIRDVSDCVICDTGGGSTEIILVKDRKITAKTSIPMGAVSLYEDFSFEDGTEAFKDALAKTEFLNKISGLPVISIGGSACAAASADIILNKKPAETDLNGYAISADGFKNLLDTLSSCPPERRTELGIEEARKETVCAGLLPTAVLMEYINSDKLIICTQGVREGILSELLNGDTELYISNPKLFLKKFKNF